MAIAIVSPSFITVVFSPGTSVFLLGDLLDQQDYISRHKVLILKVILIMSLTLSPYYNRVPAFVIRGKQLLRGRGH